MKKPADPITLYKAGHEPVRVWAIDSPGWIANGWSPEEPTAIPPEPEPAKTADEAQTVPPELTQGSQEEAPPPPAKTSSKKTTSRKPDGQ